MIEKNKKNENHTVRNISSRYLHGPSVRSVSEKQTKPIVTLIAGGTPDGVNVQSVSVGTERNRGSLCFDLSLSLIGDIMFLHEHCLEGENVCN